VWWLGEGLGGLLAGTASPVNGAPGAVLLCALLALLLWPSGRDLPDRAPSDRDLPGRDLPDRARSDRDPPDRDPSDRDPSDRDHTAPFPAACAVGRRAARACWLVVWLGLAGLALLPATRAPRALSDMIAGTTPGEPAWLAWTDTHAAGALARHGLLASVLLAAILAAVALIPSIPSIPLSPPTPLTPLTPLGPPTSSPPSPSARRARVAVILALAVAAVLWLAQGLGGLLTGAATDPGTAPLLALLALAFWPTAAPGTI
jgi:hypothetical protein